MQGGRSRLAFAIALVPSPAFLSLSVVSMACRQVSSPQPRPLVPQLAPSQHDFSLTDRPLWVSWLSDQGLHRKWWQCDAIVLGMSCWCTIVYSLVRINTPTRLPGIGLPVRRQGVIHHLCVDLMNFLVCVCYTTILTSRTHGSQNLSSGELLGRTVNAAINAQSFIGLLRSWADWRW